MPRFWLLALVTGLLVAGVSHADTITVNGDVIFASIAAGIMPGGNKMFGDSDDQGNTWPAVQGTIRTITV